MQISYDYILNIWGPDNITLNCLIPCSQLYALSPNRVEQTVIISRNQEVSVLEAEIQNRLEEAFNNICLDI